MEAGRQLTSDDIKRVLVEILDSFDTFCKNHKLQYWLAYGTALGAVRHRGFIPWDDDLDVMMPEEDYERLIRLVGRNNGFLDDNLRLETAELDSNAYIAWGKVIDTRTRTHEPVLREDIEWAQTGLWLDIFPMTGRHESAIKQRAADFLYSSAYALLRLSTWKLTPGNSRWGTAARYILAKPTQMVGQSRINPTHVWFRRHLFPRFRDSRTVYSPVNKNVWWPAHLFKRSVEAKFEGGSYLLPEGYHEYLIRRYGDYMQIPPENERENHNIEVFWK